MKSCDMVIIVPVDGVTGEEAMRVQVWETVAELLRPELGKLYRQFNPSGSVWEHKYPRPFGVVLGRQEPEVFRELLKAGEEAQHEAAAYQWGIGRVLYSLDTVWVDIERRGRSYIIKASERKKLDDAYLNALKKLGLEPAAASGIQSLLMPKTAPEQKAAGDKQPASAPVQDQRSGGTAQQSAEPQNRSAQQKPQAGPKKQEYASEPTGKTVPFRNTAQAMPEEDIYTVLAAKVQGGMSGSNTLINLETPEKKQTYAYVRGVRPELTPGTQLSHVRLTTRKQDTVVFCVLESYEVYQQGQQAA